MDEQNYSDELYSALKNFPKLWDRVSEAPPQEPFSENRLLEDFIRNEHCTAMFYNALARMFQGKGRTELLTRAADAKRRERRLRAEYFIRTGLTLNTGESCPAVTGKLASLRAVMECQTRSAADYAAGAPRVSDPRLRELLDSFARETDAAAQADRALLIESF